MQSNRPFYQTFLIPQLDERYRGWSRGFFPINQTERICEMFSLWIAIISDSRNDKNELIQSPWSYSAVLLLWVSQDSAVGIATSYWLDDWRVGVRVPVGARIFSTSFRPALGSTQPPIQWVPGALSPGVRRPGRETNHSPATSAEVKKTWVYIFTPLYALMV
jgi:hypothetical protein